MASTRRSRTLSNEACLLMPGGVSSPVRAYPPYPRFISRGRGPYVFDADGRKYVDLTLAYGPLIFGHSNPTIVDAVARQARKGTVFGAPTELELVVARKLKHLYPSMEMMRFVSTGGEAVTSVLRLARAATRKNGVVKIDGGFHGSVDQLLVKAGSGAATRPSSAGVISTPAAPTYILPFNDLEAARQLLRSQDDIGLLLVEPVLGNMGTILPEKGYLEGLRRLTREQGVLLAFDEVITGFRIALGGAQERFSVTPDLTLLGKVLGGGLPLAAYGGRREMLSLVAPAGPVYQAGTFSGNPLSMAAANAVLDNLSRPKLSRLEAMTRDLADSLRGSFARRGMCAQVPTLGSLLSIFLSPTPVWNAAEARKTDTSGYLRFAGELLNEGVFLPQSPFETLFLSLVHGIPERDLVLEAVDRVLAKHQ